MSATPTVDALLSTGALWFAEKGEEQAKIAAHLFGSFRPGRASGAGTVPFGDPAIDDVLPEGGLRGGALHEWFSGAARETLAVPPCSIFAVLAANAFRISKCRKYLVWIGKRVWPAPFVLEEIFKAQGLEQDHPLRNCIFIEPPNKNLAFWCLETALRSPGVAVVTAEFASTQLATSKRLALAAQAGGGVGLLQRPVTQATASSAAASRWRIAPVLTDSQRPRWQLELLKLKGQQPCLTEWLVEYEQGASIFTPLPSVERSGPVRMQKRGT